mmetsp:Transcript_15165/g.27426  ORF Transcript_15165/g.27426 Transcript_15165/m.27426 type:complete len:80 (+) Transcript_15165:1041-1280(+)
MVAEEEEDAGREADVGKVVNVAGTAAGIAVVVVTEGASAVVVEAEEARDWIRWTPVPSHHFKNHDALTVENSIIEGVGV